jgi:hypothetical protein
VLLLQTLKMLVQLLYLLPLLLLLLKLMLLLLKLMLLLLLPLLLLQLCDLPLKIARGVNGGCIACRPAFAESSRPARKRQQHVLGVIGQRALHKHDALESGLDAGGLQPLHALPHNDAHFVDGEKKRKEGEDVADDDAGLGQIREALELGGVEGGGRAGVASREIRRRGEADAAGCAGGCARRRSRKVQRACGARRLAFACGEGACAARRRLRRALGTKMANQAR